MADRVAVPSVVEGASDSRGERREAARLPPCAWWVFALGVIAMFVMPWRVAIERTRALAPLAPGEALTGNGVFRADGVVATDRFEALPPGLAARGSLLGGEQFQGRHETGWFRAAPKISVMVAGFPMLEGNTLALEARRADGSVQRHPFDVHNIGETWLRWTITLPPEAAAVRILATDATTQAGGWLGFSEPFAVEPEIGGQIWSVFQLICATCLIASVVFGPGLLWFGRKPRAFGALAFALLVGPLVLAGLGVACWFLGGALSPSTVARSGIALLLVGIGITAWGRRAGADLRWEVRALLAACGLLVGFAVAKANISFGPRGELFRDRVSRTLSASYHSDSQISFHTVQAIAHHLAPDAPQTRLYFAPWRFGSRGPLAGLMAAPLVLVSGAKVPFDHPTHPWRPFDREGFAVYRIACIALATLAAWAVFAVVADLSSAAWGLFAAALAMLAPFFVHEVYFSWPKLIAGALAVVSFWAAHRRRPFVAGVLVALGYLYHPLAALSAPFVGLWVLGPRPEGSGWRRGVAAMRFALGALVLVVPWQIIGRLQADDSAHQDVFVAYFLFADGAHATWPTWWQSRWDNFANTFLPGYLLTANPAHDSLNSPYERSDRWVQASFLWWNTLPFALGGPAFVLSVAAFWDGCRRALRVTLITLIAPAVFMIAYWGIAPTGLMRQCGHALFVSAIVFAVWRVSQWPATAQRKVLAAARHPACFAWRGGEVALMALGTTLLNWRHSYAELFRWNDAISLAVALACLSGLVLVLARATRDAFSPSEIGKAA